jgi:predicted O-methyltransferase YrrM
MSEQAPSRAGRWDETAAYIREVFGAVGSNDRDHQMATLMQRAVAAGLPDIAITAEVGRLLKLLTVMTTGGRDSVGRVLEVGTLAGYSGIWIARGLSYGGRLYTIEADDKHQAFARSEFARAGVSDRVDLVSGRAMDVLPRLASEIGYGGLDLAFLDADKREYADYARVIKPLLRQGGVLVADNCLGSGANWWICDPAGKSEHRDAVDRFNRAMMQDSDFVTACVPLREGVLVALKTR